MFSVRLVTADSYQAQPLPQLDPAFSEFRGSEIKHVPVIRIFGITPTGEKTCLHIHGVFPYLYVPYTGEENPSSLAYRLATALDASINVSLGSATSNTQHVYLIQRVSGIPFYGYHKKEHQFLKIYFYNPAMMKRAADLLQNGSVLNQSLQPHEAHIPYILQFMMDYNVYGMSMVNMCSVKHRREAQSLADLVSSGQSATSENSEIVYLPSSVERQSTCELEIDALASDILNRREIERGLDLNPGLAAIWEEERARRAQAGLQGGDSQLVNPKSPPRPTFQPTDNDIYQDQRLARRLMMISQCDESSLEMTSTNQTVAYAAEVREGENLLNSSHVSMPAVQRSQLVSRDETVDNMSFLESPLIAESQKLSPDSSILGTDDMSLVDLLVELAGGNSVEPPESVDTDSVLGSQVLNEEKSDNEDDDIPDLNLTCLQLDALSGFENRAENSAEQRRECENSQQDQSSLSTVHLSPFLTPSEVASGSARSGDEDDRRRKTKHTRVEQIPQYDGAGDVSPTLANSSPTSDEDDDDNEKEAKDFSQQSRYNGTSEISSNSRKSDIREETSKFSCRTNKGSVINNSSDCPLVCELEKSIERSPSPYERCLIEEITESCASTIPTSLPSAMTNDSYLGQYSAINYEPFDPLLEIGPDFVSDLEGMHSSMEIGIFMSSGDSDSPESGDREVDNDTIALEAVLTGDPCFTESAELDKSDVTELRDQYVSLLGNSLLPDVHTNPRIDDDLESASNFSDCDFQGNEKTRRIPINPPNPRSTVPSRDSSSSSENVTPNIQEPEAKNSAKCKFNVNDALPEDCKEAMRLTNDNSDYNCNFVATWAELEDIREDKRSSKLKNRRSGQWIPASRQSRRNSERRSLPNITSQSFGRLPENTQLPLSVENCPRSPRNVPLRSATKTPVKKTKVVTSPAPLVVAAAESAFSASKKPANLVVGEFDDEKLLPSPLREALRVSEASGDETDKKTRRPLYAGASLSALQRLINGSDDSSAETNKTQPESLYSSELFGETESLVEAALPGFEEIVSNSGEEIEETVDPKVELFEGTSFYSSQRSERDHNSAVGVEHRHCSLRWRGKKILQDQVFTADQIYVIDKRKRGRKQSPDRSICTKLECKLPIVLLEKIDDKTYDKQTLVGILETSIQSEALSGEDLPCRSSGLPADIVEADKRKNSPISINNTNGNSNKSTKVLESLPKRRHGGRRKRANASTISANSDFVSSWSSSDEEDWAENEGRRIVSKMLESDTFRDCYNTRKTKKVFATRKKRNWLHSRNTKAGVKVGVKAPKKYTDLPGIPGIIDDDPKKRSRSKKIVLSCYNGNSDERTKVELPKPKKPLHSVLFQHWRAERAISENLSNGLSETIPDTDAVDNHCKFLSPDRRKGRLLKTEYSPVSPLAKRSSSDAIDDLPPSSINYASSSTKLNDKKISAISSGNKLREKEALNTMIREVKDPNTRAKLKLLMQSRQRTKANACKSEANRPNKKSRSLGDQKLSETKSPPPVRPKKCFSSLTYATPTTPKKTVSVSASIPASPKKIQHLNSERELVVSQRSNENEIEAACNFDRISLDTDADIDVSSENNNCKAVDVYGDSDVNSGLRDKNCDAVANSELALDSDFESPALSVFDTSMDDTTPDMFEAESEDREIVDTETNNCVELSNDQKQLSYQSDRYAINEANFCTTSNYTIDAVSLEIPTCLFEEDSNSVEPRPTKKGTDDNSMNLENSCAYVEVSCPNSDDTASSSISIDPRDLEVCDVESLTSSSSFSQLLEVDATESSLINTQSSGTTVIDGLTQSKSPLENSYSGSLGKTCVGQDPTTLEEEYKETDGSQSEDNSPEFEALSPGRGIREILKTSLEKQFDINSKLEIISSKKAEVVDNGKSPVECKAIQTENEAEVLVEKSTGKDLRSSIDRESSTSENTEEILSSLTREIERPGTVEKNQSGIREIEEELPVAGEQEVQVHSTRTRKRTLSVSAQYYNEFCATISGKELLAESEKDVATESIETSETEEPITAKKDDEVKTASENAEKLSTEVNKDLQSQSITIGEIEQSMSSPNDEQLIESVENFIETDFVDFVSAEKQEESEFVSYTIIQISEQKASESEAAIDQLETPELESAEEITDSHKTSDTNELQRAMKIAQIDRNMNEAGVTDAETEKQELTSAAKLLNISKETPNVVDNENSASVKLDSLDLSRISGCNLEDQSKDEGEKSSGYDGCESTQVPRSEDSEKLADKATSPVQKSPRKVAKSPKARKISRRIQPTRKCIAKGPKLESKHESKTCVDNSPDEKIDPHLPESYTAEQNEQQNAAPEGEEILQSTETSSQFTVTECGEPLAVEHENILTEVDGSGKSSEINIDESCPEPNSTHDENGHEFIDQTPSALETSAQKLVDENSLSADRKIAANRKDRFYNRTTRSRRNKCTVTSARKVTRKISKGSRKSVLSKRVNSADQSRDEEKFPRLRELLSAPRIVEDDNENQARSSSSTEELDKFQENSKQQTAANFSPEYDLSRPEVREENTAMISSTPKSKRRDRLRKCLAERTELLDSEDKAQRENCAEYVDREISQEKSVEEIALPMISCKPKRRGRSGTSPRGKNLREETLSLQEESGQRITKQTSQAIESALQKVGDENTEPQTPVQLRNKRRFYRTPLAKARKHSPEYPISEDESPRGTTKNISQELESLSQESVEEIVGGKISNVLKEQGRPRKNEETSCRSLSLFNVSAHDESSNEDIEPKSPAKLKKGRPRKNLAVFVESPSRGCQSSPGGESAEKTINLPNPVRPRRRGQRKLFSYAETSCLTSPSSLKEHQPEIQKDNSQKSELLAQEIFGENIETKTSDNPTKRGRKKITVANARALLVEVPASQDESDPEIIKNTSPELGASLEKLADEDIESKSPAKLVRRGRSRKNAVEQIQTTSPSTLSSREKRKQTIAVNKPSEDLSLQEIAIRKMQTKIFFTPKRNEKMEINVESSPASLDNSSEKSTPENNSPDFRHLSLQNTGKKTVFKVKKRVHFDEESIHRCVGSLRSFESKSEKLIEDPSPKKHYKLSLSRKRSLILTNANILSRDDDNIANRVATCVDTVSSTPASILALLGPPVIQDQTKMHLRGLPAADQTNGVETTKLQLNFRNNAFLDLRSLQNSSTELGQSFCGRTPKMRKIVDRDENLLQTSAKWIAPKYSRLTKKMTHSMKIDLCSYQATSCVQPKMPKVTLKRLSRDSLERYGYKFRSKTKDFVKILKKSGTSDDVQVPAYDGAADLSSSDSDADPDVTIAREEKRVCVYQSGKKSTASAKKDSIVTPKKRRLEDEDAEVAGPSSKRRNLSTPTSLSKKSPYRSPSRTSMLKSPGRLSGYYSPLQIIVTSPKVRRETSEPRETVRVENLDAKNACVTPRRKCHRLRESMMRGRLSATKSSAIELGEKHDLAASMGSERPGELDGIVSSGHEEHRTVEKIARDHAEATRTRSAPAAPKDSRDVRKKLVFSTTGLNTLAEAPTESADEPNEESKSLDTTRDRSGDSSTLNDTQELIELSETLANRTSAAMPVVEPEPSESGNASKLDDRDPYEVTTDEYSESDDDACNVTFSQFVDSQINKNQTLLDRSKVNAELNDEPVSLRPKYNPPSRQSVVETMEAYGIPKHRNQEAFFSIDADVPKQKELAHKILKVSGIGLKDMQPFVSSVADVTGIARWRKMKIREFNPSLAKAKDIEVKIVLGSNEKVVLTPLMQPPTQKEVKDWLRARDYLAKKKKKEEEELRRKKVLDEKGKIEVQAAAKTDNEHCSPNASDSSVVEASPEMISGNNEQETTLSRTLQMRLAKKGLLKKVEDLATNRLRRGSEEEIVEVDSQKAGPADGARRGSGDSNSTEMDRSLLSVLGKSRLFQEPEASKLLGVSCGQIEFLSDSTRSNVANENLQNVKALTRYQYLTIMCLEVHVTSRGDLLPDAQYDPIAAIFYSVQSDVPPTSSIHPLEHGVIVLADSHKAKNKMHYSYASNHPWSISIVNNEEALLNSLVNLITRVDPEILIGWEIETLSWGYVFQRASSLGMNLYKRISRIPATQGKWEARQQEIETHLAEVKLPGRIVLDIWRLMRHEAALLSYTFENVIYHVLNERVSCPSFKTLTDWWSLETPRPSRWRVVEHYSTRVLGTFRILDQLDIIGRTSELARLFGIQFFEVFSRGSQFRVESVMLRLAKPLNYIPVSPSPQQRASMRAMEALPLIMEPESMFYTDPLIVLDFQSLYPSIIIAHNYCFSTCLGRIEHIGQPQPFEFGAYTLRVPKSTALKLQGKVNYAPCGVAFVKPEVRLGILPRMLTEILDTRFMVKKAMKDHKKDDKTLQRALHSRQMGLKFLANVTYGYTAANFSGRMPCIEVGDSVISKSKETLERAIKLVESTPRWGARVVYGDTDSLFILVAGKSKADAFVIGNEIADAVTAANPPPIKLKFEKVVYPAILQTKKRYCGYMYETPEQENPTYLAKGIETVRRDGCPAVSKILEKTLKLLFETKDVSLVKKYVTRQLDKVLRGKVSIQDLTFAKEFRGLKGYKAKACVPALELTKRLMKKDPRAVPRNSERVRYVIVAGAPNQALIHCVRTPWELINDPGLRPNAIYYVTRVIIPPLNRCLNLMGVDVNAWYRDMPHRHILDNPVGQPGDKQKLTIFQYFGAIVCAACGQSSSKGVCTECAANPADTLVVIHDKLRRLDRTNSHVTAICQSCVGQTDSADCASLDCPVFYRRAQSQRELTQATHLRTVIECGNNFEL